MSLNPNCTSSTCDMQSFWHCSGQWPLGLQVYSVSVSPFFGVQAPGPTPQLHGDLGINFSCSPANTHHLIDAAVSEVHRLQVPPPPFPPSNLAPSYLMLS